jgi:hypothetical protein
MALTSILLVALGVFCVVSGDTFQRIGHDYRAQVPPTFGLLDSGRRSPSGHWHPAIRSLAAYVAYNRAIVDVIRSNESNCISRLAVCC